MGFCKYGEQKTIGRGIYYICSSTGMPCKFARWCSSESVYKPNANFGSCATKINRQKQEETVEAQQPQKIIKKKNKKTKKVEAELVDNINEEDIGVD